MTEQTEGAEVEALDGVGAWRNHDDPRDEWPGADDWTLSGIAGMLADAEDEFWTAYHRVCEERGEAAGDEIGNQYEAMARRILTGPEAAGCEAAAEVRGAQAALLRAAEEIPWTEDVPGWLRARAAAAAAGGGGARSGPGEPPDDELAYGSRTGR